MQGYTLIRALRISVFSFVRLDFFLQHSFDLGNALLEGALLDNVEINVCVCVYVGVDVRLKVMLISLYFFFLSFFLFLDTLFNKYRILHSFIFIF